MSLSTAYLRDDFKAHLEHWENTIKSQKQGSEQLFYKEIQNWGVKIEQFIQEKVRLLEIDFNEFELKDEYLRTVSESFNDLERIMRSEKTLLDNIKDHDSISVLKGVRDYYTHYFIPLANIFCKLENDYIAVITNAILDNGKKLNLIDSKIKALKKEKRSVKNRFLSLIRVKVFDEVTKQIKKLELYRKLLRLTIQHDKLNLYYFNHERPPELKEIKEKADALRAEIRQNLGANYVNHA